MYSAVVLDRSSRKLLLAKLENVKAIPEGWEVIAHHMTITFGKPLPENLKSFDNKVVSLTATDIGISDKALAIKVSGFYSDNSTPHITIAVNRKGGGKPVDSNKISQWKALPTGHFKLQGTVKELK